MKKKERAIFIETVLNQLYPSPLIPLSHKDPYTLLIAVLLSARCTDKKVNQITPLLFAKADTPEQMILLDLETVQSIIRPCGLSPQKASAILKLSKILIEDYRSIVPREAKELEKLPGVGHKTASVVLTQAFGIPMFPIDTHIHRCAKRWRLTQGKNVKQTEEDLKNLFPESHWGKLHLQMIYYGREYCPARGHCMEKCLICQKLQVK